SAELAFEALRELQQSQLVLTFSFLGDEVVFQNHTLRELKDWEWSERFTKSGIQRVEFVCEVIREEFEDFLYTIMAEVTPGWRDPRHTQRKEGTEYTSIRYGAVGVRGDAEQFLTDPLPVMGMNFPLDEEAETIEMIYGEVQGESVTKAGAPSDDEWDIIRRHPIEGARIILMSEPQLDVAAIVAYEHHMLPGGLGYPTPHFDRECHYASRLVQVCDCYDALRTRRFHRGAWPPESALRYVEDKAGTVFDADIAKAFVTMMRRWERRVIPLEQGQT